MRVANLQNDFMSGVGGGRDFDFANESNLALQLCLLHIPCCASRHTEMMYIRDPHIIGILQ